MSIHKVAITQITGLSNATWNTVDLDSFVTVPSGASAAIFHLRNTNTGGLTVGLRTTGKTNAVVDENINNLSDLHAIVPLGSGNQVDLYRQTGLIAFYLIGFFSSSWTWFDIDATAVELPAGTGSIGTVTAPNDVPASSNIILLGSFGNTTWRPKGETTTSGNLSGRFAMLKLDASRQVDKSSASAQRILGYSTSGVTWRAWYPANETGSIDGTFYDSSTTDAGKAAAYVFTPGVGTTEGIALRQNGDTTISSVQASHGLTAGGGHWYPMLDAGGIFEWGGESGATFDVKVLAYFSDADAPSGLTITSVTPSSFDDGRTGIVIAGSGFGASQGSSTLTIGGQAQTVTDWKDDQITFTSVRGSNSMGARSLTITRA